MYDDVEGAIRDVLAARAGRKVPASIGELKSIVAEVLAQRAPKGRHSVVAVTTGEFDDSQRAKFDAVIEKLQSDGVLKTRWHPDDIQDATYTITDRGKQLLQGNQPHLDDPMPPSIDTRKVFVVYGRNTEARESLFNFLRSIGLHPLEWTEIIRETGNAAPYTGEVLEKGFAIVQAVVVLLTPDDEARLIDVYQTESDPEFEKELTPQPRPNVLVEAGMALGLHPKRTLILEMGELRPVSNLIGRSVLRMDNSTECRHDLAQRLIAAGCAVSLVGKDWLKCGNFAVPDKSKTPSSVAKQIDSDAIAHDRGKFNQSDLIVSETDLNDIIERMGQDHKIFMADIDKLDRFCRFFRLEQNRYMNSDLSNLCSALVDSLEKMRRFVSNEFHAFPSDQTDRFCMAPSLNVDREGDGTVEEAEKYHVLTEDLNSLLDDLVKSFRNYRRRAKEFLAV